MPFGIYVITRPAFYVYYCYPWVSFLRYPPLIIRTSATPQCALDWSLIMARVFPLHLFKLQYSSFKPWKERIRHFTWAWHAVIMGTGIVSALCTNFPYGSGSAAFRWLGFAFFMLNLSLFVFVCTCTITRYVMFPETWGPMLSHPSESLFISCFPMGVNTLINASLVLNQDWNLGGTTFLHILWGTWWLNSLISYIIAFCMLYVMIVEQDHSLPKMTAVWLLPVVTLVVASSSGGLLARALQPHSTTMALLTTGFSFTMVIIGLSFALMILPIYLLRLITYGAPDVKLILSTFVALGPLGQGGYSLLVNGENISNLLPLHIRDSFPFADQAGQMIFAGCFLGSYVLWSMGIAWIILAAVCIFSVVRKTRVPFSIAYWGMVFPHGTFALVSVQLAKVLDSPFFRAFGAIWSIIVLLLWVWIFVQSIPAFIDGSLFKAPDILDVPTHRPSLPEVEKGHPVPPHP